MNGQTQVNEEEKDAFSQRDHSRPPERQTIPAHTALPRDGGGLLEAGRYAPSGHNKQAWRFTAILDQKLLQELNQLVRAGFAALALGEDAPKELRDAKAKAERQGESYHFTYDAPCLIIASNDTSDPNAQASCACALENMFLAACEMGLGSCWVNQLHWLRDDLNLRKKLAELGVPEAHTLSLIHI